MLIGNHDLLIEVINFLLSHLSLFLNHVVSRDKYCVEVFLLGEGWALRLYLCLEVWLAVFPWNECEALHSLLSFESLKVVGNFQVVNS